MHRCLYVFEIVALIAENALLESESETNIPMRNWRTVAALARTCKAVYEPASDVLWREQVELVNLVKCLPRDAWEEREIHPVGLDGWKRKLYFTRPLTPSDVESIQHVATRIRSLYFLSAALTDWSNSTMARTTQGLPFTTTALSKEALKELGRCHPTSLLPKLRMIWLGDQLREEIFQSSILFSSTTRVVSMTADVREYESDSESESVRAEPPPDMWQGLFGSALKHMRTMSPDIIRLDLVVQSGIVNIPIEFMGLGEALLDFVHLQILTLEGVVPPFTAFSAIHSLPNLKELQIGSSLSSTLLSGAVRVNGQTNPQSALSFLKGLVITADSDLAIIPVVSLHRMPMLRDFLASAWFEAPAAFLQILHDHLDHSTVASLHLDNVQDFDSDYDEPEPLTGEVMVPLLAFRNLRMLFIHGCIMSLTDEDILRMSMTWPALERLSICSEFDVTLPRVTLAGLRHLVERCPNLKVLEITFCLEMSEEHSRAADTANRDSSQDGRSGKREWPRNMNITRIHVGASSPEGVPASVAAKALSDLFPRLRTLDVFKDCDSGGWKKVEGYLPKNRKRMQLQHDMLEVNILESALL